MFMEELKNWRRAKEKDNNTGIRKVVNGFTEKLAKKEKCKEIKVISGVGVREYYRKLGYVLEEGKGNGEYMRKEI